MPSLKWKRKLVILIILRSRFPIWKSQGRHSTKNISKVPTHCTDSKEFVWYFVEISFDSSMWVSRQVYSLETCGIIMYWATTESNDRQYFINANKWDWPHSELRVAVADVVVSPHEEIEGKVSEKSGRKDAVNHRLTCKGWKDKRVVLMWRDESDEASARVRVCVTLRVRASVTPRMSVTPRVRCYPPACRASKRRYCGSCLRPELPFGNCDPKLLSNIPPLLKEFVVLWEATRRDLFPTGMGSTSHSDSMSSGI